MNRKVINFILLNIFNPFINFVLNLLNFTIIFRFGAAIGDHVYLSSIIRQINLNSNKKIILFTNFPDFFFNNPRIKIIIRSKNNSFYSFLLKRLKGNSILEFRNQIHGTSNDKHILFNYHYKTHLAEASSSHFPFNLNYKKLKNELFFSEDEKKKFKQKFKLKKNFSIIHSETKKNFTKSKDWKKDGMQKIVNKFDKINWIQVGITGETKLKNCNILLDLTFRELAYLIKKSNFVVCYEGLYNHLASCFNKKTFLIHTGFLPIEAFKYQNTIIIENNHKMKCYPCYNLICKNHTKDIKKNLSYDFVFNKIKNNI
jgi:ADP-heptose:LPS heptosyltransferase